MKGLHIVMISKAVELKPKFNRLAGHFTGILGMVRTLNHSLIDADIGRKYNRFFSLSIVQ